MSIYLCLLVVFLNTVCWFVPWITEADLVLVYLQNSQLVPKLSAVQIRTRSVVFGPRLQAVAAEQDNFLRILKEAYNWVLLGQRMMRTQFKVISSLLQEKCSSPDYSRIETQVNINLGGLYCQLCILEFSAWLAYLTTRGKVSDLETWPETRKVGIYH